MGSSIEFNDTLKLTFGEGFPADRLNLKNQRKKPIRLEDIANIEFRFNKGGARVYHPAPTRCFLVHNINGKWLYWGHIIITGQTISYIESKKYLINKESKKDQQTSGKFRITKIYDPKYQKQVTINESPEGKSYF